MGRLEPSVGQPPANLRKAARAKKAKVTINQLIPSLLPTHPRARRGIEAAELIVSQGPVEVSTKPRADTRGDNGLSSPPTLSLSPRLRLQVTDTLTAARALAMGSGGGPTAPRAGSKAPPKRVAILNMASALSPGGGFLNGATSQEESLCMRTTLLPSLKDEWYRLPELGAIYTPDALAFRDGETGAGDAANSDETADAVLEKRDRWFFDCITAAMLRNPDTDEDDGEAAGRAPGQRRYTNDKDRELVLDKMRMVMRICQAKGAHKVVLGAWGCGAYGNPVGEIARAWRRVLVPRTDQPPKKGQKNKKSQQAETWQGIEEVVFAIKDTGMAAAFESAFGEGLERDDADEDVEEKERMEESPVSEQTCELQERIQELQLRIESTANPGLKEGLGMVLARMKSQLPLGDGEDSDGTD
ncbi:hypothetical protein RB595_000303 [Gaeumannomyces hyphopodioides]